MINQNLKRLRKLHQYTQEEVAQKIHVSRQAVAKWESGETIPDINSCVMLANLYDVTLDNLVHHCEEDSGIIIPPKGKYYFGHVKVSKFGDIRIPKQARDVFNIQEDDQLLLLGDENMGMAIVHERDLVQFMGVIGVVKSEK